MKRGRQIASVRKEGSVVTNHFTLTHQPSRPAVSEQISNDVVENAIQESVRDELGAEGDTHNSPPRA